MHRAGERMTNARKAVKPSRRDFLKTSAALAAAAQLDVSRVAFAAGSDTIKIGFIGCGARGTGACRNALSTQAPVKLVAMGDLFADRIESSLKNLRAIPEITARIDVKEDMRFVGVDAYQKVIACGVDLVLLTTPPPFRPLHYAADVKAGKQVFMEKPCCIDAPGYRLLVATNAEAKQKGLSVGVGLQRRHQSNYLAGIRKIRDGAVGEITLLRTYFNVPTFGRSDKGKPENVSEMEYQIRGWYQFLCLSGDHIVEQAVHEIDIANWAMDAHPVRANGMGGRQVRTGRGNGDVFDHHFVEYEFANGVRHFCQARHQPGTWQEVSDNVHGTKGMLTLGTGAFGMGDIGRRKPDSISDRATDSPYQREHDDLLASIVGSGPHLFAADYAATSSMTAVLGRMATYSGKVVTWEEAVNSQLSLLPKDFSLAADPPAMPDAAGYYPFALPGVTKAF
jgi:myo-inositol 2-dehydrogenase / D-chiro-inositol 1-dehydrogenase